MSKFKYSKTIRPLKTDSFIYHATLKKRLNQFRGNQLDKPIHLYRMWWHLVRLVVDCEENKIKFGAKEEHSVKLNKRYYKDWDINYYLDASFDDWFADKIHLFAEEKVQLVNEGEKSKDYQYIKFKKTQRKEDIIRQVRKILPDKKFKSESKYQIQKQYKYFYIHQQYNAFIMKQDDVSGMDIADWLIKYYSVYEGSSGGARVSSSYSSMRRLYRASERLVIDVSKGLF